MHRLLMGFAILLLSCGWAHADYSQHPKAEQLVQELTGQAGYTRTELLALLRSAKKNEKLIEAEQTAPEKTLIWSEYQAIFLQDWRIRDGVQFIRDHAEPFARAQRQFGVPPQIIAAIIGVETRFGGYTGTHRVLDSLATQGFDHPTRADFFYAELKAFLLACREFDLDPYTVQGSYAGAMGLPQFMPSNYRRLALDFDDNGVTDLWSVSDAVGSAANYLVNFRGANSGWQAGSPVATPAQTGSLPPGLNITAKTARYTYPELRDLGVTVPRNPPPPSYPVGLIALDTGAKPQLWLTFQNFYSLHSYNPRNFYAMAVFQLSEAIAAALRSGAASE